MSEYGCKVCRVLAERELDGLDSELIEQWKGESGERLGYRRLADWLNTVMLRREMEIVGMPTGGNEARSRYERLREEETGPAVERLLRRGGVAVDQLTDDFVSYSVVRTHLKDCLDARRESSPPSDWERDRLESLEAYAESESNDALRSLANKGRIDAGGDIDVTVTLAVRCSRCGVSRPFEKALAADQFCDCS